MTHLIHVKKKMMNNLTISTNSRTRVTAGHKFDPWFSTIVDSHSSTLQPRPFIWDWTIQILNMNWHDETILAVYLRSNDQDLLQQWVYLLIIEAYKVKLLLNPNHKLNFPPKYLNLASLRSLTCAFNAILKAISSYYLMTFYLPILNLNFPLFNN